MNSVKNTTKKAEILLSSQPRTNRPTYIWKLACKHDRYAGKMNVFNEPREQDV